MIEDRPVQIKSKIICTIGPKTQSVEMLAKLVEAGMGVMRMNFSHGSHEYHSQTIQNLRTYLASTKNPRPVAILLDTKGPEIRSGKLVDHCDKKLIAGSSFTFHNDDSILGDSTQVSTSYKSLATTVKPGDRILVDDGLIGMLVNSVNADQGQVVCTVENDGMLGETKGVNLPGNIVDLPAITKKDAADIEFGIQNDVDFIAASFIRKASDVLEIRERIKGTNIKIISKIENQEGIENFDSILKVSDGIMVARGDLGVEIPVEQGLMSLTKSLVIKK
jgi:pyruvate kinase